MLYFKFLKYIMNLLIFPNNLYEKKYIPKNVKKIYILEDPIFFGFRNKTLNFNKLKLVLHRSSMKYYEDYLKKYNYDVKYIELKDLKDLKYKVLKNVKNICYFELNDFLHQKRLNKIIKNKVILNNPNFIISLETLEKYNNKKNNKNKFFHKNFYEFIKNEINILNNTKSYDNENRNSLPKNIQIPSIPNKKKNKYELEAIQYINKLFPKNYGKSENLLFPNNHSESKKWFKYFLKNKFSNFGKYQDAIHNNNNFMFHSTLSPMINIGLLNPDYIVKETTKYYKKYKIKMNNYEGFIRQIIGWREYQRYCYLYGYDKMTKTNYFNNKNKLNYKWYSGETKIKPIDNAIVNAFETGYLHHIARLMLIANFMNLCRISPDECYKWFMEYSVDSYDWLMTQNVYSMGMWSDGGLTMRKPYISSDNYVLKMSNYKKDNSENSWNKTWNSLYYNFLLDNKKKLEKTIYIRNLSYINRLKNKEKKELLEIGKKYLKYMK